MLGGEAAQVRAGGFEKGVFVHNTLLPGPDRRSTRRVTTIDDPHDIFGSVGGVGAR
ncbi:hypothetical protein GCM10009807_16490 [Microbacterium lacus]|uniref:Uncharacterized protein n=1 Tax=Microbacterium lacus TaxID=415217 RepID=A0ABN2GL81_9MICO